MLSTGESTTSVALARRHSFPAVVRFVCGTLHCGFVWTIFALGTLPIAAWRLISGMWTVEQLAGTVEWIQDVDAWASFYKIPALSELGLRFIPALSEHIRGLQSTI